MPVSYPRADAAHAKFVAVRSALCDSPVEKDDEVAWPWLH
jgi:hypothetical protein